MKYDLGGGIEIDANGELEKELSLVLPIQQNENSNISIHCDLLPSNMVGVSFDEAHYLFERTNWLAQLFQLLPQIYRNVFPDTVLFHGSCFRYENNLVLLLGHSKSGKSTALYNLLKKDKVIYISDEIIAINAKEKYIIPLSNKPIQLRSDVIKKEKYFSTYDAWHMNRIIYFTTNKKETERVYINDYNLICCFIKYNTGVEFESNSIGEYELLNLLFRSCFNISKLSYDDIRMIIENDIRAIKLEYNGNIEKILEVCCDKYNAKSNK